MDYISGTGLLNISHLNTMYYLVACAVLMNNPMLFFLIDEQWSWVTLEMCVCWLCMCCPWNAAEFCFEVLMTFVLKCLLKWCYIYWHTICAEVQYCHWYAEILPYAAMCWNTADVVASWFTSRCDMESVMKCVGNFCIVYPSLWPSDSCKESLDVSNNFSFGIIDGILSGDT